MTDKKEDLDRSSSQASPFLARFARECGSGEPQGDVPRPTRVTEVKRETTDDR